MFFDKMKKVLKTDFNDSKTENGATGYKTTGSELLNLNFAVSSLRKSLPPEIRNRFAKAYNENPMLALKWLFFARDIRGGLGERRLFRIILQDIAQRYDVELAKVLMPIVSEYGRFDDLFVFFDTAMENDLLEFIKNQIENDLKNFNNSNNGNVSLLAKWLPSINTSSKESVAKAKKIAKYLGYTEKEYRKTLVKLRKRIDVVEIKMSANEWGKIKYERVPSKANLLYNKAFFRHDEDRRLKFLEKLKNGETKINAGTIFPHEIVHKYGRSDNIDDTLEQLWKALPDTIENDKSTIVVADGSGSMMVRVDNNSSATALSVANALAIYFSERTNGEFKNQYITFSNSPQLVKFSENQTLRDKLRVAYAHGEVANTNIEAVFDLILKTAIKNKLRQSKIPKNILIVSDMEFDNATSSRVTGKLFDAVSRKYINAGYRLPRLIFWNVASRTQTIPVIENDLGVVLISGFSANSLKMVMSGDTDPYKAMVKVLNSERYALVENCAKNYVV